MPQTRGQGRAIGLGVDDERVQHHDLAVRRVIAPVRPRVGIDLRLVENGRADDLTVLLLHEKVAARKRGLRRRSGYGICPYPYLLSAAGPLQLFDGTQVSLIDPLTISDWAPMRELLLNQDVTKYLHAGSEDLEVFLNAFNLMPQPLIDTQILAAFCGRPMSWGFASMVEEYSGVALDKSESRTDWLARPLTERQCEYAQLTSGTCCRSPAN